MLGIDYEFSGTLINTRSKRINVRLCLEGISNAALFFTMLGSKGSRILKFVLAIRGGSYYNMG